MYPCTNMTDVTYSEIATAAYKVFGTNETVNFLQDKPNIPSFKYHKDDSLYQKIDFYPQISIEEGIRKIANNHNKSR
jgi:nucleoside-diphosphate-sugar epimerase